MLRAPQQREGGGSGEWGNTCTEQAGLLKPRVLREQRGGGCLFSLAVRCRSSMNPLLSVLSLGVRISPTQFPATAIALLSPVLRRGLLLQRFQRLQQLQPPWIAYASPSGTPTMPIRRRQRLMFHTAVDTEPANAISTMCSSSCSIDNQVRPAFPQAYSCFRNRLPTHTSHTPQTLHQLVFSSAETVDNIMKSVTHRIP